MYPVEQGMVTIVLAFFSLLATVVGTYATIKLAQIKSQGDIAATKTDSVVVALTQSSTETQGKLDDLGNVLAVTHALVNSNFGVQLKIAMVALERVAELTKNVKDIEAARIANLAFHDHEKKQAAINFDVLAKEQDTKQKYDERHKNDA